MSATLLITSERLGKPTDARSGKRRVSQVTTPMCPSLHQFRETGASVEEGLCPVYAIAQPLVRILKVARTVADLEGAEDLEPKHLSEAVQYRTLDRNLWL